MIRCLLLFIRYSRDEYRVVASELHTASVIVARGALHPLGHNDQRLTLVYRSAAEVSESRTALGYGDLFRGANYAQSLLIDLGDKQRSSVPRYMVIICTPSGVNEIELAAKRYPMLLRVVVFQDTAVVPGPRTGLGKCSPSSLSAHRPISSLRIVI